MHVIKVFEYDDGHPREVESAVNMANMKCDLLKTRKTPSSRNTLNAGVVIPRCLLVDSGWLLRPFHAPPPSLAYGYPPAEEGRGKTRVGKDVG